MSLRGSWGQWTWRGWKVGVGRRRGWQAGYSELLMTHFAFSAPGSAACEHTHSRTHITYTHTHIQTDTYTNIHNAHTNSGRDVPVFLERSVIDFRCVMVDHTYREKLVVRNSANTAMKVSVLNRADVADYFEFSPNFGFVQVS